MIIPLQLKRFLRNVPGLYPLRAFIGGKATVRNYKRLCEKYQNSSKIFSSTVLDSRLMQWHLRQRPGILKVFFLGTDEQQDRSGLLQALSDLADVRVFTRADGCYGQNDPRPPIERIPVITARLLELLDAYSSQGWIPDVLIGQTWAQVIEPAVFSRIRERWGTLIINISMDDRHQFVGTRLPFGGDGGVLPLLPHLDLALTAAPECVKWYEQEGCPAFYFPEASDPEIFLPIPDLPKHHDVCFVGARYGIREKLVSALRSAGISVQAHGSGWEGGRLSVKEMAQLFAQSKIVLGVGTVGYCKDFYALKLRDFDAPMSGSCYLTHDNQDLRDLFEVGEEIETYSTADDCVEKVKALLADEPRRESIAVAGRKRALRDHTWDKRFRDLFCAINGVAE